MGARMKGLWPLAIVGGVLVFLWVDFCFDANFGPKITGPIPQFSAACAAAFVSWGFYFAAGTGKSGFQKALVGSVFGVVAGWLLMMIGPKVSGQIWGAALTAGVLAIILIFCIAINDIVFVPAAFGAFASVVFVWIITGLANLAPASPTQVDPTSVAIDVLIALVVGCVLGILHTTIAAAITPKGQKADEAAAVQEIVDR
jgi:Protein of unknown function (DUF1097)